MVCRSSEQPGPSTGTHGLEEKPTPRLRTRPADALTSACGAQAGGPSPTELRASEPPLFKAAPFGVTYYAATENDNTFVKYFGAPTMRRSLLGAGDTAMGKTDSSCADGVDIQIRELDSGQGANEALSGGGDADP